METGPSEGGDTVVLFREEEFEEMKKDPERIRIRAEDTLRQLIAAHKEALLVLEVDHNRRFNQLEQRLVSVTKQNEVLLEANQRLKSDLSQAGKPAPPTNEDF